jgi:hypothetical protein
VAGPEVRWTMTSSKESLPASASVTFTRLWLDPQDSLIQGCVTMSCPIWPGRTGHRPAPTFSDRYAAHQNHLRLDRTPYRAGPQLIAVPAPFLSQGPRGVRTAFCLLCYGATRQAIYDPAA